MKRGFLLAQPRQKAKQTSKCSNTYGVLELRPGLVCLEADMHNLHHLVVELRKHPYMGQAFPLRNFTDRVATFLAIPFVGEKIIDAGVYHTCAINTNKEPIMFGQNSFEQCEMPSDLGPISAVAAGGYYTCAIQSDGQLRCSSEDYEYDYNPPEDLGPVKAVACGEKHTCVIMENGELQCFGRKFDDAGQSKVPQNLGPVFAVSAGTYHTCAIRATGELVCFGENMFKQSSPPPDLGKVFMVAAGDEHTCAIQVDGTLRCFGCNDDGQCDVPCHLGPIKAVAAGQKHTCAVKVNGDLVCFGSNSHGQCSTPSWLHNVVSVAAGAFHSCAVQANGRLVCFGAAGGRAYDSGQCNVPVGLRVSVNLQPLPLQLAEKTSSIRLAEVQNALGRIVTWAQPAQTPATPSVGRWCSDPNLDLVVGAATEESDSGLPNAIVQDVQHTEIAAEISPGEAALVAAEQQSTWIQHNINASAAPLPLEAASEPLEVTGFEKVLLLRFTRNPRQFEVQIHEGRELEPVRTALQYAGLPSRLPSGAGIFVHPEQYSFTKQLVAEASLRPYHVIVAEPFLCLVEEAVASLRHGRQGNVRLRSTSILGYCSCACRKTLRQEAFIVEKTFLDVPRVMRNPQSVVQSTGAAHGVPNPRRRVTQ